MNQAVKKLFAFFLVFCIKDAAGSKAAQFAARGATSKAVIPRAGQPLVATPEHFLNLVSRAQSGNLNGVAKKSLLFEYQSLMTAQNIAIPQDIQEGLRKQQDVTPIILGWLQSQEGRFFLDKLAEIQVEEEAARRALFEQEEEEHRALEQRLFEVPAQKEKFKLGEFDQQIIEGRERRQAEQERERVKREEEAHIQALAEQKLAGRLSARSSLLQLIDLVAGKKEPGFEQNQVQKQLAEIETLKQQGFALFVVIGINPPSIILDEVPVISSSVLFIERQKIPVFILGIKNQYIPIIAQTYSQFADANMRSFDLVISPTLESSFVSQGTYTVPAEGNMPELVVGVHLMNSLDDIFVMLQNAKKAQLQQQEQEQRVLLAEESQLRQEQEKEQEALLKEAQRQEQQARILAREAELAAEERMFEEEKQELQSPRKIVTPSAEVVLEKEAIQPEEVITEEALQKQEPKGLESAKKEYKEHIRSTRQDKIKKRVAQKEQEKKEKKQREILDRALQALKQEKSQLVEQLNVAKEELRQLRLQYENIGKELGVNKERLEQQVLQQNQEKEDFKKRFEEQNYQAANKMQEQKDQFEREIEQLKTNIGVLTSGIEELNKQNDRLLQAHAQELVTVIDKAQQDQNALQIKHAQELEALKSTQEDILKRLQEEQQSQQKEQRSHIDTLKAENNATLKQRDEALRMVKEGQQELQGLQEQLRVQESQNKNMQEKLVARNQLLEQQNADQQQANQELKILSNELRTDLYAAQQERLRAQEDSARKDIKIESLEAQVASSQDLFGQQEDLVKNLQAENQELVVTMERLREQMETDGVRIRKETADAIEKEKTQFAALQQDQEVLFQRQQVQAQEREKVLHQKLREAQDAIARQKDSQAFVDEENIRLKEQLIQQEAEFKGQKDALQNQVTEDLERQLAKTTALQQEAEKLGQEMRHAQDQFEAEKRELQDSNRVLQSQNEQLGAQVSTLKEEVDRRSKEHEGSLNLLRQENKKQLDSAHVQYQQAKEVFDVERIRLRKEIEDANQQLTAQKRSSQEALEAKEALIQKAESVNKELSVKLDVQQKEVDQVIQNTRTQLEDRFNEDKAAMQKEQKEIVDQRDRIIAERDTIKNRVQTLEQAVAQSATEKEQKEQMIDLLKVQLEQEKARALIKQEELEGRLDILLQDQQDMRLKNQAEKENFVAQIKRFEEQKAQLEALVKDLKAQGITLSEKHEADLHVLRQANLEQLNNVLEPYQQAKEAFDAERARLRKEVEAGKQQLLTQKRSYQEELEAKEGLIQKVENKNKELREIVDAQKKEADAAIDNVRKQLEDQFNQYKVGVEANQKSIDAQLERVKEERDVVKSRVHGLEKVVAQSVIEKEQKEHSIDLLKAQVKRLQSAIDLQDQRFEEMQSVVNQKNKFFLDHVAQTFAQKDAQAQEEVQQLQRQNKEIQLQLQGARQELAQISTQMKDLEDALKKAQDQVLKSQKEAIEKGVESDLVMQRLDVISSDLDKIQDYSDQLDVLQKQVASELDELEQKTKLQEAVFNHKPQEFEVRSHDALIHLDDFSKEIQKQSAAKEDERLTEKKKQQMLEEALKKDKKEERKILQQSLEEHKKEEKVFKNGDKDTQDLPKKAFWTDRKKGGGDEKDREKQKKSDGQKKYKDIQKERGAPIVNSNILQEMLPEEIPLLPPELPPEEKEKEREKEIFSGKKINLNRPEAVSHVAKKQSSSLKKQQKKAFASAHSEYKGYISKPYISSSDRFLPNRQFDDIKSDEDFLPDEESLVSEPMISPVRDEAKSTIEPTKQESKPSVEADKAVQEPKHGLGDGVGFGSRVQAAFKKYWKQGLFIGLGLLLIELLRRMR